VVVVAVSVVVDVDAMHVPQRTLQFSLINAPIMSVPLVGSQKSTDTTLQINELSITPLQKSVQGYHPGCVSANKSVGSTMQFKWHREGWVSPVNVRVPASASHIAFPPSAAQSHGSVAPTACIHIPTTAAHVRMVGSKTARRIMLGRFPAAGSSTQTKSEVQERSVQQERATGENVHIEWYELVSAFAHLLNTIIATTPSSPASCRHTVAIYNHPVSFDITFLALSSVVARPRQHVNGMPVLTHTV
jgi:hypothetical protein